MWRFWVVMVCAFCVIACGDEAGDGTQGEGNEAGSTSAEETSPLGFGVYSCMGESCPQGPCSPMGVEAECEELYPEGFASEADLCGDVDGTYCVMSAGVEGGPSFATLVVCEGGSASQSSCGDLGCAQAGDDDPYCQ